MTAAVSMMPKYQSVRDKARALINRSQRHIRFITEEMAGDDLSIESWHRKMVDEIKMLHGALMIAAKGGGSLDDLDMAALEVTVRDQVGYLDDFAVDLSNGSIPMDGRVVSRALMYANAAWATFEERMGERMVDHKREAKWERRMLSDAEHCEDCVKESKRGWRRIGQLAPIGTLQCLTNCKCHFEYSDQERRPTNLAMDEISGDETFLAFNEEDHPRGQPENAGQFVAVARRYKKGDTNQSSDEEQKTAISRLAELPRDQESTYAQAYALDAIRVEHLGMKDDGWFPASDQAPINADFDEKHVVLMGVPLSGIGTSQDAISVAGLSAYIQRQPDPKKEGWPEVARDHEGKYHILSGHTRLGAVILSGRTHGVAKVWQYDADRRLVKEKAKINLSFDDLAFEEKDHPRGQPDNPGQFVKRGEQADTLKESVANKTPTADTSEEHFLGVRRIVQDTRESWGYRGDVEVKNELGGEFEVGGLKWRAAGLCRLSSRDVTIFSPSLMTVDAIRHISAHEMMHGTFEEVYSQYDSDQDRIGSLAQSGDERIHPSGELKTGNEKQFPTYARFWKFREDTPPADFASDDGITNYSKAYWEDYKKGKCTFHTAMHETMAEIAAVHEATGVIQGSKIFKDYYKAVRDEYRMITGQQKARKAKLSLKDQRLFTDHVMYLDARFNRVVPTKAVYIRWWRGNGDNGWGVAARNKKV